MLFRSTRSGYRAHFLWGAAVPHTEPAGTKNRITMIVGIILTSSLLVLGAFLLFGIAVQEPDLAPIPRNVVGETIPLECIAEASGFPAQVTRQQLLDRRPMRPDSLNYSGSGP